jgi:murein DD-endopeptidase MepM/ murein hydrolase activator NlpD
MPLRNTTDSAARIMGGLEALGFIAPTPAHFVAPVVENIGVDVAAIPLTRRQLREMEALQASGPQVGVLRDGTVGPAANASPTPWATSAGPRSVTAEASYSERRRRGEGTSPHAMGKSARGSRNYTRTAPPLRVDAPQVARVLPRKRLASQLFTGVVMIFVAAFLVGTTVPANAFIPDSQELAAAAAAAPVSVRADAQSMAVPTDVAETATDRGNFTVTSYAQILRAQYGNISYSYAMTTGAVRWPFPYVVPISSGFGSRVAPCRGCSSMHMGIDFVPGAGTPIYAIADGVVREHKVETWGLGNSVVISHTIGGKAVDSVYAHMQAGSVVVEAGQEIKVGDLIGLVGSTGTSTGSHLHFEIHLDGVQVDPFAWLKANVTN